MQTVGIIGCGGVAAGNYSYILKRYFSGSRIFCSDTDEKRAQDFALMVSGHAVSTAELINQSDLVIIATPPATHYTLIQEALQADKKILCEKPFLLSLSEAKHIHDLSKKKQADVFVAHVRRFFAAADAAKSFIETGVAGEVKKAEVFEGGRFGYESASRYVEEDALGGVLPDMGSHSLDTLLYVLGWDEKIIDFEVNYVERNKQEPSHVFKADFKVTGLKNAVPGSLYLSRRQMLANKINIHFENGLLEIPVMMTNAVRFSNDHGSFLLRNEDPVKTIPEAFDREFRHIIYEGGEKLKMNRFLNLTSLLEKLLNHRP